jgi:hypothetical protein
LNELYKKDAEERILSMPPKLTDFMKINENKP